jgi:hypothetical protein
LFKTVECSKILYFYIKDIKKFYLLNRYRYTFLFRYRQLFPDKSPHFQEPEAKGPAPWGQSAGGFGGLPHFENRFGGGGMFQPPPFPPQRGLTNGTNNPNVIVVDTNQLTTR